MSVLYVFDCPHGRRLNFLHQCEMCAKEHLASRAETIRTQQATIDRLTVALRPLANMADHFPTQRKFGNRPTSGNIYECDDSAGCHGITVEDCHSAKALIAEIEAGK